MSDYTITEYMEYCIGGEPDTQYKVQSDEGRTLGVFGSREAAEAKIAGLLARREQIAAKRADYSAHGLRLAHCTYGVPKVQRMRGMKVWAVVRGEGEVLATFPTLDEVPAAETFGTATGDAAQVEATEAAPIAKTETAEAPAPRGTITDAQAATIENLIADGSHEEGGFYAGPTDRAGILTLSRGEASTYIDSLTGTY